jgi:hypothetical protein
MIILPAMPPFSKPSREVAASLAGQPVQLRTGIDLTQRQSRQMRASARRHSWRQDQGYTACSTPLSGAILVVEAPKRGLAAA